MICTFFGHKDTPDNIEPVLRKTLIYLIENKSACLFYVGNRGKFDGMVRKNLKILKTEYPHIDYAVVLAYMPGKKSDDDYSDTILPDGLENVPPKYAIEKRGKEIINISQCEI